MKNERKQSIIFILMASVLWSTGGLLIKLVPWHPVAISGMRSGIAAIMMYFYIKKFKGPTTLKEIFRFTKPKYLGAVFYASTVLVFVIANKMTTAANTILLQYSAPIWVALIAHFFLKDRVKKRDWVTVFIVFLGMGLFFVGDVNAGNMFGNFLAIISGITFALSIVMIRLQEKGRAIEMTFIGNIMTFIVGLPFYFSQSYSTASVSGILLLGIFQLGLAYILFTDAAPKVTPLESILIPVIEPLLNPIWVFLFYGEQVGFWPIIGGGIVLFSIVIKALLDAKEKERYRIAQKLATS